MAFADSGADGTVFALAAAFPMTLAGTVAKGDILAATGVRADADNAAGPLHADLVALEAGVSGGVVKVCPVALISGRISGATAGNKVYSSATAGSYTETKPNAAVGDATTEIGVSIAADKILINIAGNRSVRTA